MTPTNLVTAFAVGLVIAFVGIMVVPRGRLPFWTTPAAATAAVLLGAFVARVAGIGVGGFRVGELVIQAVFGLCAVILLAAAADRRTPERQERR
jgi:hypothetical protein